MGEPALPPWSYLVYFQCDPKVTLVGGTLSVGLRCFALSLALLGTTACTAVSTLVALHRQSASLFSRLPSFLKDRLGCS